jgi:hypothetical protein
MIGAWQETESMQGDARTIANHVATSHAFREIPAHRQDGEEISFG